MKERNPIVTLSISLRHAKEYLEMLCELRKAHSIEEIQESNNLLIKQRALWIALIIEIGRLFDTYEAKNKEVISLKKIDLPEVKQKIDEIHGNVIIGKIIETRKTFTAHWSKEKNDPISIIELCNSNLKSLLGQLDKPLSDYES
jgi:type II secretory pathway component GspD/PulD (secretin)